MASARRERRRRVPMMRRSRAFSSRVRSSSAGRNRAIHAFAPVNGPLGSGVGAAGSGDALDGGDGGAGGGAADAAPRTAHTGRRVPRSARAVKRAAAMTPRRSAAEA
jgi:hypothetical protein